MLIILCFYTSNELQNSKYRHFSLGVNTSRYAHNYLV